MVLVLGIHKHILHVHGVCTANWGKHLRGKRQRQGKQVVKMVMVMEGGAIRLYFGESQPSLVDS